MGPVAAFVGRQHDHIGATLADSYLRRLSQSPADATPAALGGGAGVKWSLHSSAMDKELLALMEMQR